MAKKKHDQEDDELEGTNSAVTEALEELDDGDWDETEEGGFDNLPEGTYQCKILSAAVVLSKSKGKLQIAWQFEVLSPAKYKGRKIFKYRGIADEEGRSWAKTELAKLGVDWPKKKLLPKTLSGLEDTYCELKLVDSGSGDDCYKNINKALDEDDIEDADDDAEEDERPVKKRKQADDEDEAPKKKKRKPEPEEDDDEEEDAPPAKKKKPVEDDDDTDDEEDDEEPAPKKKKKDEDDSDDEDEDEDEDVPSAKKKKADDDDNDADCTIKFSDDDLDAAQIKTIKKIAKAAGIDPDDYEKMTDLLGDTAEEVGVTGVFKTAKKLLAAIDEAK